VKESFSANLPRVSRSLSRGRGDAVLFWFLTLILAMALPCTAFAQDGAASERTSSPGSSSARIYEITISDAIGPVTARFVVDGVAEAERDGFDAVLVHLDTPGGLDVAMREMVKAILGSEIPVIVFVSPSGARAASAGLFIALAAPVAAMSPGTNIGAATPVSLGGGAASADTTMAKKVTNDSVAYIRSLAERWGRNADWAEEAVRDGVSVSAEEAVVLGVVDLIADDRDALLVALEGRTVQLTSGDRELRLRDATFVPAEMTRRDRILAALTNPSLAYLLLLAGILGIALELYHPGSILPGTVGGISLILAFFALQQLPVNAAGVLLLLLGMVLFFLETQVPSFGVLSVGGFVSLILGSIFLFRTDTMAGLSFSVILPTILFFSAFLLFAATMAARAQKQKRMTGREGMEGEIGQVVTALEPEGRVFVHGEYWSAIAAEPVEVGRRVRVRSVDGLKLDVEPVE